MPQHSAMPLFLHSIMGVGTNLFPMTLEQRDRLATFLTADELAHIEIFPSTLRIFSGLMVQLEKMSNAELDGIQEFECCRLLGPQMHKLMRADNAILKLTGDQFWVHLNYHLIHFMDFLPINNWKEKPLELYKFARLHALLSQAGRLYCGMKFDSEKWVAAAKATGETENTQEDAFQDVFSERIGHRLYCKVTTKGHASRL